MGEGRSILREDERGVKDSESEGRVDAKRYDVMYYLQDTGTESKKERESTRERTKGERKRVSGVDT